MTSFNTPSEPAPLSPIQIAMWPSVRQRLKNAYQSEEIHSVLDAWWMARHNGLEAFAKEDLGWQAEAFLEPRPGLSFSHARSRLVRRASQFEALGLDWARLAPHVASECAERLRSWASSPAAHSGSNGESTFVLGVWASVSAFLSCVGVGVLNANAPINHPPHFKKACASFSPLAPELRERLALSLLALADDPKPRADRISNAETFQHFFSARPWDEDCALWGSGSDFESALRRIAETAELERAAARPDSRRPGPRV